MTGKPKRKPVEVLNPRYAGATPEMVALALLRHKPDEPDEGEPSPIIDDPPVRSSI